MEKLLIILMVVIYVSRVMPELTSYKFKEYNVSVSSTPVFTAPGSITDRIRAVSTCTRIRDCNAVCEHNNQVLFYKGIALKDICSNGATIYCLVCKFT